MRLRTRYALVLLVLMVVLGAVVFGTAQFFQQQTENREQATLDESGQLAAAQVEAGVNSATNELGLYATRYQSIEDPDSTEFLNRLLADTSFQIAALVDADGTVIDLQGDLDEEVRQENIGVDIGDTEPARSVLQADDTRTDRAVELLPPQDDRLFAQFAVPILDSSGDTVTVDGAIVADGALDDQSTFFNDVLGPVQLLETSTQTVEVVGTDRDGGEVTLREPGDEFEDSLTTRATVPAVGWTVTVERDRSALTDQLQLLQFIQFGSLFVVLLAVAGLGYFEYRTNLRQTERLLAGFDELTAGNFGYSLSLSAAREWNRISDGFNELATGLREREETIREREKQIRERERRLSVLNRVLRHNLQNDMTVIQGHAQLIPDLEDRERREQTADTILRKSEGLVDHGKKARQLETIMENAEDPPAKQDVVRKVQNQLSEYSSEYPDVTVGTDLPEAAWVSAVSGIEFGIDSLIENAFEHNTSDDPEVTVSVREEDTEVVIEVADNGPGIPEHEREVITGEGEETSLEHGSGIGLWLAFWAAEKSGGSLAFPEPDGDGGVAEIRLPSAEPPTEAKGDGAVGFSI